jgi:hypothetical protein
MTDTVISLVFSVCGGSSQTHLTDALIFAPGSILCAVASMILTGLAASMPMGLRISAFFEDFEEKKARSLESRFDGSE